MKTNAKRILKKVQDDLEERKSGRVTLYLNLKTVKAFQAACKTQGLSASPVVEELMREFILSLKKKA